MLATNERRSTYQGSKVEVTSSSRSGIFRRPSKNQSFFLWELPPLEVRWSWYLNSSDNHPHKKKLWISKCQHIRLSQTKSDLGDVGYQWKDGARIKEARSKLHLQVEVTSSRGLAPQTTALGTNPLRWMRVAGWRSEGQAKTKVFFWGSCLLLKLDEVVMSIQETTTPTKKNFGFPSAGIFA